MRYEVKRSDGEKPDVIEVAGPTELIDELFEGQWVCDNGREFRAHLRKNVAELYGEVPLEDDATDAEIVALLTKIGIVTTCGE